MNEVYPRVGGGTTGNHLTANPCRGLSPRGRGNLTTHFRLRVYVRSIPAWAGEPSSWGTSGSDRTVYPRVGGGTLGAPCFDVRGAGLSPRGRGNPHIIVKILSLDGSIPAWAGEPRA